MKRLLGTLSTAEPRSRSLTVNGEVKAKSSALVHAIDLGMQRSRELILQRDALVQSPTTILSYHARYCISSSILQSNSCGFMAVYAA